MKNRILLVEITAENYNGKAGIHSFKSTDRIVKIYGHKKILLKSIMSLT